MYSRMLKYITSLFRYDHILLGKRKRKLVAASDSLPEGKAKADYVCDGLLELGDEWEINKAIADLDKELEDLPWVEIKRKRRWKWPWQYRSGERITRQGEGGLIYLLEGTYNISNPIKVKGGNV